MNRRLFSIIPLVLLASLSISWTTSDANEVPVTFHRDADGKVTKQSKVNAKIMKDRANQDGHVVLWLVLNYEYNLYPEQMTAEEIAAQEAAVATGFAEVLDPLVSAGVATYPKDGPLIRGPGSAVKVTKRGLMRLLQDERILQMSLVQ